MNATAPGWVFGAYAQSNFTPCLTSANAACGNDPSGKGWLRLTDQHRQTNERQVRLLRHGVPPSQGVRRGTSVRVMGAGRADGIGVIFFDGSGHAGTFRIGRAGRLVWYAGDSTSNLSCRAFTLATSASPSTSTELPRPPTAQVPKVTRERHHPDSISIRGRRRVHGASNTRTSTAPGRFPQDRLHPANDHHPANLGWSTAAVVVTVVPSGAGATYTVVWKTASPGRSSSAVGPIATHHDAQHASSLASASTGGSTNYHEIGT